MLISEVVRPALRGRVAASVQSGYSVGYAISVGLLPIVASFFPEAIGWRVLFALAFVAALVLPETSGTDLHDVAAPARTLVG